MANLHAPGSKQTVPTSNSKEKGATIIRVISSKSPRPLVTVASHALQTSRSLQTARSLQTSRSLQTARGLQTTRSRHTPRSRSEHAVPSSGIFTSLSNISSYPLPDEIDAVISVEDLRNSSELLRRSFASPNIPPLNIPMLDLNLTGPISPTSPISPPSIITFPPIVTTPRKSPTSSTSVERNVVYDLSTGMPQRVLTTSGLPLNTPNHTPELHTFFSGTQHEDGSRVALSHSYPCVTVIFADIVGFTSLSSTISAQELVTLLNKLFNKFDVIMEEHKLEKIRTIGDAYLCVGNMSMPLENAEEEAVRAGKEMIAEVRRMQHNLSLRVGIASGPLIAGVTGITKWNYDIFGKPLSHANLMETMAPPNYISISKDVYEVIKDSSEFNFMQKVQERSEEEQGAHGGHKEAWTETDSECYLMDASAFAPLPLMGGISVTSVPDSNMAILAQPALELEYKAISGVLLKDITDASSTSRSDDMEMDLSQKFDFTNEELTIEENMVAKKIMPLSFKKKAFEDEYRLKSSYSVHDYTIYLSGILALVCLILLLSDIANSSTKDSVISMAFYALTILVLLAYIPFTRKYDYRNWSGYVAGAVLIIVAICVEVDYVLVPTEAHLSWVMLLNLCICNFIRAPVQVILLLHIITGVFTSLAIIKLTPELLPRILTIWTVVFTCFFGQQYIQRSLRKQFLSNKRIKYDMHSQRIAQHRAEMLIHNILPEDIIPRLHTQANAGVVDLFEQATMIFINLTNLVELTADLDPGSTFQVYNEIFTMFDEITHSFGIEKIKTINTVYMVACGLPTQIPNHADVAVHFAAEIYRAISQYSFPLIAHDKKFRVRIGVATGPVVAGIIGRTKYAYDCWSDTTNTASRMESNGWNGYVQLTPDSFFLLKNKQNFEKRVNLYIKGKGSMDTYVMHLARATL